MALNRQTKSLRIRRPRPGELHSYMHSEGFTRLAGKPTAPGSLPHTRSPLIQKIIVFILEVLFLAVGVWFIFH